MKEISHHILDVTENSITAGADLIQLSLCEDTLKDRLTIVIEDNGCGMDEATQAKVTDPFYTTRTTRKVGMGLSLFKANALLCEGDLTLTSKVGQGTKVVVTFKHSHIDRPPLGAMADTLVAIVLSLESADLVYRHEIDGNVFELNTKDMRDMLGDEVPLSSVEVLQWVKSYVLEGLKGIRS